MNRIVLKEEVLDRMKSDEELRKLVAGALNISVNSLPRLLYGNDPKLTQAAPLKVLREYLGLEQDKDLLEEIQISKKQIA